MDSISGGLALSFMALGKTFVSPNSTDHDTEWACEDRDTFLYLVLTLVWC